jgi:serine phosphatase RsbU (regulator of sigma subunit)
MARAITWTERTGGANARTSTLVQVPLKPRLAGSGDQPASPALPRRHEPDLTGLAAFTLDAGGLITAWSVTATALFGHPAAMVIGHDVCDVLMTGPGQRELVRHALAEASAGRVWTATVAGGQLGEGRFSIRWEPLAESCGAALVIVQRAWPQPRPSWLSEGAARIGTTLDLAQTAGEVADVAVPGFADATAIYAAERMLAADELASARPGEATAVRRLASRLAWPEPRSRGLAHPGEVLVFTTETPVCRAMATGRPVMFEGLDSESARRLASYPGGPEIVASYSSFLAMPLAARGAVIGCVIFARAPASPPFNDGDVTLAAELASRAAVCIDNARLYDRERRTATALQRGLLPMQPQVPDGLEVAHRYLPVGASVVGGDWHDIIPLSGGRAVLVVGDAMGHGPEAAAVMVQLRTAARTLADLELPPEQVLPRLDKMAAEMAPASFATCIYAVIDPADGSCVVARAGHLPAILVRPDGTTQVLDLPPGLPLGLGAESFQALRFGVPAGATLALYTDGLVESRSRPIDTGMAALREALAADLADPSASLDSVCARVTAALQEHGEDDITLVLARIR